jgi:hypothetical protein
MDIILGASITILGTILFNFWSVRHNESRRWDEDRLDALTQSRIAVQRLMGFSGAMVEGLIVPPKKGVDPKEISDEKDKAWYSLEELAILFPGISKEIKELQKIIVERVNLAHECIDNPAGRQIFHNTEHQSFLRYTALEGTILKHCQARVGIKK